METCQKPCGNPPETHSKTITAPCPRPVLLGTRKAPSGPSLLPTQKGGNYFVILPENKKSGHRSNRPFAMNWIVFSQAAGKELSQTGSVSIHTPEGEF